MKNVSKIVFMRYKNEYNFPQWHDMQFIHEWRFIGINIEVIEFSRGDSFSLSARRKLINSLKNATDGCIVLSCLLDHELKLNNLDEILKKSDVPVVTICFDNLQVWHCHKLASKVSDVLWLTSPISKDQKYPGSAKRVFIPYGANDRLLRPSELSIAASSHSRLKFFGTAYGARAMYISKLLASNVDIDCFGRSESIQTESLHKSFKGIVSKSRINLYSNLLNSEVGRKLLYSSIKKRLQSNPVTTPHFMELGSSTFINETVTSSLVLNSAVVWNSYLLHKPIYKQHLRLFETPSMGGVQLLERHDEILEYFTEGKEIILFESNEELLDKSKFYLNTKNHDLVSEMKVNAYNTVKDRHSWSSRLRILERVL